MTEELHNDKEREAMIIGDRAGALEADEAAEVGLLADLLADPSTWAEPNPGLEDAIVRAVADARPATRPVRTAVAADERGRPARRRRRGFTVAALGAAAASIAVAVVMVVSGGGTGAGFEAQLTATALAPGAHASATIGKTDAGFRITLDAHGLPRLPGGAYYAAWLTNGAGTVVPAGTFSSSDGTITLWSGVSPEHLRTLTVTVQPPDEATASGQRVLVGRVHAR